MPDYHVVDELLAYLLAEGVGVDFNTPSLVLPCLLADPIDGAPAPRAGQEVATVTLRDTMLAGPAGGAEAYIEESFVDVIVRALDPATAKLIHRSIRGLLHPIGDNHGRQLWTMGGLLVELSTMWRAEQPLDEASDQLSGSGSARPDPVGWSRIASYRFEVRRKALAGQPYAP